MVLYEEFSCGRETFIFMREVRQVTEFQSRGLFSYKPILVWNGERWLKVNWSTTEYMCVNEGVDKVWRTPQSFHSAPAQPRSA